MSILSWNKIRLVSICVIFTHVSLPVMDSEAIEAVLTAFGAVGQRLRLGGVSSSDLAEYSRLVFTVMKTAESIVRGNEANRQMLLEVARKLLPITQDNEQVDIINDDEGDVLAPETPADQVYIPQTPPNAPPRNIGRLGHRVAARTQLEEVDMLMAAHEEEATFGGLQSLVAAASEERPLKRRREDTSPPSSGRTEISATRRVCDNEQSQHNLFG